MDFKVDEAQVKKVLESGPKTANELAEELGIEVTQENRKKVFQKIRSAARKVVDESKGSRSERNENKEVVYKLG